MKLFIHWIRQHEKLSLLTLSFIIPAAVMAAYFCYRGMGPFGSSTLLTVDLGQQYVDFFAYFRHTLLSHPSGFFYTFQKALGGEMFGVWTYYLMSPFNFTLLLFSDKTLPSAIFWITVLKYGAAGLSFAWLLMKTKVQKHLPVLAFSTSYALMGWMVANQLNLMWLDAVIILPLIIWGIIQLVDTGKMRSYVGWLAALLIINYYMAYMVCLFAGLFFLWYWLSQTHSGKAAFSSLYRFIVGSVLAAGIAAVTLLPTWYSLGISKNQYLQTDWSAKFEYFPPKMLAKFFIGSFNFSQMPKGTPNLFIGSLMVLGAIFYFLQAVHPKRNRWLALLVTVILALSLCFEPLDLLWHGMQFPIWYPYRFSFVVSFWLIWLAANTLKPEFTPTFKQLTVPILLCTTTVIYVWVNVAQFSFLSQNQMLIGSLLLVAAFCLVALPNKQPWFYQLAFVLFAVIEMTSSAATSLNRISYVTKPEYQNYQQVLSTQAADVTDHDHSWYRMTPTFMRTKNDPLSGQFNGGSVFSSTLEKSMPTFMGNMGEPDGDGFVTYSNGTLLSDSLLNMKYVIDRHTNSGTLGTNVVNPVSTRTDLTDYQRVRKDGMISTYKNPYALPLGFLSSNKILSLDNFTKDPTQYQANLWSSLTGNPQDEHLFGAQNFDHVIFQNVKQQTKLTGAILQKNNLVKPGVITFNFTPKTNNAYYLTLGANLIDDNVSINLNHHPLAQYPTYRNTIIVNVADHQKGKPVQLQLTLKKATLWLQNFTLYQFNNQQFAVGQKRLAANPLKVTQHSQSSLTGSVDVKSNDSTLMTTIPYSKGWHVAVDGHAAKAVKVAGIFTALKLQHGRHTIRFRYWPPMLTTGLIMTLISLGICAFSIYKQQRHH
ncbi:bacterial membrane protein YfhO [Secundilactobacillus pentosiphilus]|uniref:Bacterial membrane protein YfhO n=1 Tax=Secundilactobacillus pentosiphilus TaxID=1714682 RepID=A0A1Z5ILQ9_9LACO|nr:YfhO family protein [Secundilactobacillus pentosiphilus]GAX02695.1 bacterial membrane protein YfhO [Secundilactobacillus pentosiphilus]